MYEISTLACWCSGILFIWKLWCCKCNVEQSFLTWLWGEGDSEKETHDDYKQQTQEEIVFLLELVINLRLEFNRDVADFQPAQMMPPLELLRKLKEKRKRKEKNSEQMKHPQDREVQGALLFEWFHFNLTNQPSHGCRIRIVKLKFSRSILRTFNPHLLNLSVRTCWSIERNILIESKKFQPK